MSKRGADQPMPDIEALCPQFETAVEDIFKGDFGCVYTGDLFPAADFVAYRPVYFDETTGEYISQQIFFADSLVKKPQAQINALAKGHDQLRRAGETHFLIDVQTRISATDPGSVLASFGPEINERLRENREKNVSQTIGGILLTREADTKRLGLRGLYSKTLFEGEMLWLLRDMAINQPEGLLNSSNKKDELLQSIKGRDDKTLRNASMASVLQIMAVSKQLKPALVYMPGTQLKDF